jgi:hypothetical protein
MRDAASRDVPVAQLARKVDTDKALFFSAQTRVFDPTSFLRVSHNNPRLPDIHTEVTRI